MHQQVEKWKAAWESLDAEKVAAMRAPSARHQSAWIDRLYPELGRAELRGRDEIREYARRVFTRFTQIGFEILTVVEDATHAAVEYRRHSNVDGANPAYVLELLEWSGDVRTSVLVSIFSAAPEAP